LVVAVAGADLVHGAVHPRLEAEQLRGAVAAGPDDDRTPVARVALAGHPAAAVAIGRWDLVTVGANVSPLVLIAALALLVPAAILNVIVLWTRSARNGQPIPDEPSRAVVASG
jgi:hypothetical protein